MNSTENSISLAAIILFSMAVFNFVDGWQSGRAIDLEKFKPPPKTSDYSFVVVIDKWESKKWVPVGHGTLYNPWTVITTARIFKELEKLLGSRDLRIGAGINDLKKELEITRQYRQACMGEVMPGYDGKDKFNVAVLHVSEAFRLNKYVNIIQFPTPTDTVKLPCRFGGFGGKNKEWAEVAEAKALNLVTDCRTKDKTVICTTGGPCSGDEGSPLVCTNENRMFAFGIAMDFPLDVPCGAVAQYFAMTTLDWTWFNKTLDNGRDKCRSYFTL